MLVTRLTQHAAVVVTLAAAIIPAPRAALASPELKVDGVHFRDPGGRVVVLRGLNVAGDSKVPPFRPISSPALLDPLPRWGMNVVRLLFNWEAYEPERGTRDPSYLDYIARTAEAAWARGLYVVVDFHQDAFSRYSIGGCGDGFPAWAIPASIQRDTPDNGPSCADWGIRMLTDLDMHASWGAFHRGENGVRDRYLAMVEAVAARLVPNRGVVGYDLMNEPWGDEPTELTALHRDAAAAIRRADPGAIIFVSPHALISSGQQTRLPKPAFSGVAYAPHYYDGAVLFTKRWGGAAPDRPFANMRAIASSWGVPLFVGELGAPAATVNGRGYLDALYQRLDETFASAAQWVYSPNWRPATKDGWNDEDLSVVDDMGRLRPNFRPRPYPPKIAGTPTRLRVTSEERPENNVVELWWEHAPAAGVTEIFVPRSEYFGTETVQVQADGEGLSCTWQPLHLHCRAPAAGPKHVAIFTAAGGPGRLTPDGGADGGPSDGGVRDASAGAGPGGSGGCGCRVAAPAAHRSAPLAAGLIAAMLMLLAASRRTRA